MYDIVHFPTTTATTTTAVVNDAVSILANRAAWPTHESNYKISQDTPSYSNYLVTLFSDYEWSVARQIFASQFGIIYSALIEDQEPLGSEFEAVWDAHLHELYES